MALSANIIPAGDGVRLLPFAQLGASGAVASSGVVDLGGNRIIDEGEHDYLTGLPNRSHLATYLPEALARTARGGRRLAVLFLDLDRFRCINDSCGHDIGDQLLRAVARRLRTLLHRVDLVARIGGDEFAVILEDVIDEEEVNAAAAGILAALAEPFVVKTRSLVISASIGVSLFPRDGANVRGLLRHADAALYHAKDRGRNNCQVFRPAMGRRLRWRATVESRLRQAIQEQQFEVFYQPIVDIRSFKVAALEALLRWKDPLHGWISPEVFIDIAEETGLIIPIGEFVLDRVLRDIARWRESGCQPVPVAINVSAVQLQRGDFCRRVVDAVQAAGIDPSMLQVELTERALFERREDCHGEAGEDAVTRLRDLGIHVSIDDFGTGYSSLSYLKNWRVDSLKIDRTFVRDLATDPSDLAITAAICAMARCLDIPVVSEGVEDWRQLQKLRELGSTFAQGYLFSKPVPAEQCTRYLCGDPVMVPLAHSAEP
jgi:diguanylate cyclase (GGDEF)-like protein